MIFKGTGVALVTPFHNDGNVDFTAFGKLIDYVTDEGVDFLLVMGTTAESATLNQQEKQALLNFAIEHNNKRLPILYGIGGNNTMAVCNSIKAQNLDGVDGILSVAPYYNKPTQEGMFEHFNRIAQISSKPIILYNVPGRTSSNILPETVIKLANKHKNIIGLKAASGNMAQIMTVIKDKPKNFTVLSGDDALTLPLIAAGAEGVISVVANAFPKDFSRMLKLAFDNNYAEARKIHYKLIDIISMMFEQGNPAGVKAYLHAMGLINNIMRLPITPVNENLYKKIEQSLNK
ncbi:MAG TPA: 4-hydroxy-tetrahydrodipicolinate synthase [Bacteroidales bacterium]|nr:4-hydroxy-tetrahydrodipicolinate synthase [Bacteroidales bacterium]MDD4235791.1 4-hydroxy-tetrahydrodipicolinate synthase [Bacteroidales bacterium]HXK81706.1 4-hydroxy-tetrahydrodipicolinate synthase [Bacteroidales bacterium]